LSNPFPIYVDPVPPSVTGVSPPSGEVRGGNEVDVVGSNFMQTARVTFAGASAPVISRSGTTRITVQVPPGASEGERADVTVSQPTGSGTLVQGYTYTANGIGITWTGSPRLGDVVTISLYGPAGSRAAVAIGPPGSTTDSRTGFTFCFGRPLDFVRRPSELRLGANGQVDAVWTVQGELLDHEAIQGIVEQTPGLRDWVQTSCLSLTIVP
jgi:hypothetical protein